MPELPEVEAARRRVEQHCVGRSIEQADVADDDKVLEGVSASDLAAALVGRVLLAVGRKGKHLWLHLDGDGAMPLLHFGMTGNIVVKGIHSAPYVRLKASEEDEDWPPRFVKMTLTMSDGVQLAFTDARRFARIRLVRDPPSCPLISSLGPDAFVSLPPPAELHALLVARNKSLKAVLLDQAVLSGIGNWVADEVLFQSRIHPELQASLLSVDQSQKLHEAIETVLSVAVSVDADSDSFPPSWIFHKRWDKKPGSIDGHRIEFVTVGGRTSAFVPALQKMGPGKRKAQAGADRKSNAEVADVALETKRKGSQKMGAKKASMRKKRGEIIAAGEAIATENGKRKRQKKPMGSAEDSGPEAQDLPLQVKQRRGKRGSNDVDEAREKQEQRGTESIQAIVLNESSIRRMTRSAMKKILRDVITDTRATDVLNVAKQEGHAKSTETGRARKGRTTKRKT